MSCFEIFELLADCGTLATDPRSVRRENRPIVIALFVLLFVCFVLLFVDLFATPAFTVKGFHCSVDAQQHSHHQQLTNKGSCWCGTRDNCVCTPSVAIDVIAVISKPNQADHVVLVRRKAPPHGLAIPGGFVNVGESVEQAARREFFEETNLFLSELKQMHVFSSPKLDPRRHTTSIVFSARVSNTSWMKAGDDAGEALRYPVSNLKQLQAKLAFPHHFDMLMTWLEQRGELI
eukprot:TRINITY_DN19996_c0_g1_i2.p1 TRINITY_DN19996_c0_g1~~TRINITY_DN19996_c0_g1_i2.p1  ORF type:complete len:233 (-),score=36.28 TRINITY_DN19996_c0_g1_i2:25-723(-)